MQTIIIYTENCVKTMLHTYSQTEKQTESMAKWQANRQNYRKIEIQTTIQTDRHIEGTERLYAEISCYTDFL